MHKIKYLIDGYMKESGTQEYKDLISPLTNEVIGKVPIMPKEEINEAITKAYEAYLLWKDTPIMIRARVMFKFQELLKKNLDQIAEILSVEQGKTFEDSKGDLMRGIEVVEFACGVPSLMMGETVENVSNDMNTLSYKVPLGVCAGVTPFNFPGMIPLWMFPIAIAIGNAFILKPSELVPNTAMKLAELFLESGAPKNILQVIHGQKEQVDILLDHPLIKAYSFVGSPSVGAYIYSRATKNLKRAQSLVGAKNHMVIMPDANKKQAINALIGSSMGAAGQRCMATSVVIFVGSAKEFMPEIIEKLKNIAPGPWDDNKSAYGPIITKDALNRILKSIERGIEQGANLILDGRDVKVDNYPNGNWLGPCVFDNVKPEMEIYQKEIFGPVLSVMYADNIEEALNIIKNNQFGNGTSIYTTNLSVANKFVKEVSVGQVGVNVGIPVPLPFFSFTGWKGSFYGDLHAYGKQAVTFYTETKTVTQKFFNDDTDIKFNF